MTSASNKVIEVSFVDKEVRLKLLNGEKEIKKTIPLEVYLLDPIIRDTYIDDKKLKEIDKRCVENEIFEYAVKLLSKQAYSSYSLIAKLEKKYPKDLIEIVISKLEDMHFIDDNAYVIDYIESKQRKAISLNKIIYELKEIGYEDIDESIKEVYYAKDLEYANIFVKKYLKLYSRLDKTKLYAKLYRQLVSRGYDEDTIKMVLSENEVNI